MFILIGTTDLVKSEKPRLHAMHVVIPNLSIHLPT
jgi:hypothetical protein